MVLSVGGQTDENSMSTRNYHHIELHVAPTGDSFLINGAISCLPFSAATQDGESLIPQSYHVTGMLLQDRAARNLPISSRMVAEIHEASQRYTQAFRNNPSAAKSATGHWFRI